MKNSDYRGKNKSNLNCLLSHHQKLLLMNRCLSLDLVYLYTDMNMVLHTKM